MIFDPEIVILIKITLIETHTMWQPTLYILAQ